MVILSIKNYKTTYTTDIYKLILSDNIFILSIISYII